MAKAPEWLRRRRDFCEAAFSFLVGDFGYHRSLHRFQYGGFQIGYLGPGAGVLVAISASTDKACCAAITPWCRPFRH
jgi:hypothetical protein